MVAENAIAFFHLDAGSAPPAVEASTTAAH
jgi:hypothetical protein